jgi:hypothetical protein
MDIIPFEAEHLEQIVLQDAQAYLSGWVSETQGLALERTPSFTGVVNGIPVGAAGIIPQWKGRAIAWAFISEMGPTKFLAIHRGTQRFLDQCYIQRIEMTVDADWPAAHRWANLLGFKMEAERMSAYSPDGNDCSLYARVL